MNFKTHVQEFGEARVKRVREVFGDTTAEIVLDAWRFHAEAGILATTIVNASPVFYWKVCRFLDDNKYNDYAN